MVSLHGRSRRRFKYTNDESHRRDERLKYTNDESHRRDERLKYTNDENHRRKRRLKNCAADENCHEKLPDDIMIVVANKLDLVGFNRFSAVCKAWHSIANEIRHQFLRNPHYPWLMFSMQPSESELKRQQLMKTIRPDSGSVHQHHLSFFSHFHGENFMFSMPDAYGSRCCGSDSGWLIMVGNNQKRCNFLWNPFTSVRIELPPQATLPYLGDVDIVFRRAAEKNPTYIRKAMLFTSSEPTLATNNNNNNSNNLDDIKDDLLVVAIYDKHRSAFCKPRDGAWTAIGNWRNTFEDFIFYGGKLYAITLECDLKLVELAPHPKVSKVTSCNIPPPPPLKEEQDVRLRSRLLKGVYLVECLGELLMVIKMGELHYLDLEVPVTKKFQIFKLDLQNRCWIKVEDLGHQMLFIGTSTGFSLSALNYPLFKGNCIYFGVEYSWLIYSWKACYDLGVYNLENNTIEPFFRNCHRAVLSSLIWFKPISWQ